jgi:hypothetical protein
LKLPSLLEVTRGWASPDEDGEDLFGWDPTMMYDWISKRAATAGGDLSEMVDVRDHVAGLVLDRRNVKPLPQLLDGTFFYVE